MNSDKDLEDITRYLKLEKNTLGEDFSSVKYVGEFTYPIRDMGTAKTKVYEVQLNSGRKIFAVRGGYEYVGPLNNVISEEVPNAEVASKLHLYKLSVYSLRFGLSFEDLEEVADDLNLPENFRIKKKV